MRTAPATLLLALLAAAPAPAGEPEQEFTLGLVQKELRVGMSETDVIAALGSPNVLTRSGEGREAWVYDRVASEARLRSKGLGGGAGGAGAPGASLFLGLLGGHVRDERTESRQRTLTVVVKFDAAGLVESFAFHASRF